MIDNSDIELEYYNTKNAIALEKQKAGLQMYIEMNKSTVMFSAKALRGAFILNGGAATAILASQGLQYAGFACWYGLGAFIAVIATALAYLTNFYVVGTWEEFMQESSLENFSKKNKQYQDCLRYAAAAGVISGGVFVANTIALWSSL